MEISSPIVILMLPQQVCSCNQSNQFPVLKHWHTPKVILHSKHEKNKYQDKVVSAGTMRQLSTLTGLVGTTAIEQVAALHNRFSDCSVHKCRYLHTQQTQGTLS